MTENIDRKEELVDRKEELDKNEEIVDRKEELDKNEEIVEKDTVEENKKEETQKTLLNKNKNTTYLSNIKKITNKLFLLLVKGYHIFISILALIGPYLTNHTPTLLFLVVYYCLIVTLWYIFDGCVFTDLENYLEKREHQYNQYNQYNKDIKKENDFKEDTYEDGSKKSFITSQIEYFLGEGSDKYISFFITIVPFINTVTSCIKIYRNVQYNDLY
jgi:hypothetical protein